MNQINVIHPYKFCGQWVFDDENTGLYREAFVAGADDMLEMATADFEHPEKGVVLIFSADPFPGHTIRLEWQREEMDGNVYLWRDQDVEGWLCPALLKYFEQPPTNIYVQIKPGESHATASRANQFPS